MGSDALKAASAANRDVAETEPSPFQDCRDVLHVSVFFDGTGNNEQKDGGVLKKWSNVGRMYYAMRPDDQQGNHSIYISGVGTPYNGKATWWLESANIWIEDGLPGSSAGSGGARRLRQGDATVSEVLANALIQRARTFSAETASYAANKTSESLTEIDQVLAKYRLIKIIDMSFFGFSRGAALARAFSNRVLKNSKPVGTSLMYHGYPMRQSFMGIFDTVASFGVPSKNVRLPFEDRELMVSPRVERCVHYVAAHEVRFSFPVDLIRKNGKLAGGWVERVYPGVHSDVGGGYLVKEQGVDNNYARIPMRDMMREAVVSGVRMFSYEELEDTVADVFEERFKCREDTLAGYQSYIASCGAVSGTVENQIKRHLEVFYSASGTMHRQGIELPGEYVLAESKFKRLGAKGMAYEVRQFRAAAKLGARVRFGGSAIKGYAQFVKPEDWQLSAWDTKASHGTVNFVANFIHDSKVDFIGNIEPFSYFRPRGLLESNVSIWSEWGSWMLDKRDAVADGVSDTYDAGKKKVGEAVDTTTQAVSDAADATRRQAEAVAAAAQRKAEEAALYAQRKANEAAAAARRAYDATAKAASDAAIAAQHKAQEAADYARRQARAAANKANEAYQSTKRAGAKAASAAGKKIDEVEDSAEKIYDQGVHWIRHTAKSVRDLFN